MHVLAAATTTFVTLVTLTSAAATPSSPSREPARAAEHEVRDLDGKLVKRVPVPKCGIPGNMVCGWDMVNRGYDPEAMRDWLCEDLKKCDRNNGDVWNALWHCTENDYPVARWVCGGEGSCVVDRFNWMFTCKGGSC
ncbi:hypothetical protein K458DRAFT_107452 [Lentithecium fluviatile CBS 122367]|uniref:SRCR domain-containing protein n=1 Tax=Lentithecium fluviatile CBS 122367 TaxID=1168545 RepID=A0A6G1IQ90_9PLEO|nr:hypothetical protein K458DRAFT_107452 [Lentithecium fluviatile CBS 122367]